MSEQMTAGISNDEMIERLENLSLLEPDILCMVELQQFMQQVARRFRSIVKIRNRMAEESQETFSVLMSQIEVLRAQRDGYREQLIAAMDEKSRFVPTRYDWETA